MFLIVRQVAMHSLSSHTNSPKHHSHQVSAPLDPGEHHHVLLIRSLAECHKQGGALLSLSVKSVLLVCGRTLSRASVTMLSSASDQRKGG